MSQPDMDEYSMDWEKARQHLETMEKAYKDLIGVPGINPYFVLAIVSSIRKQFDSGDRSESLYKEIMELG